MVTARDGGMLRCNRNKLQRCAIFVVSERKDTIYKP